VTELTQSVFEGIAAETQRWLTEHANPGNLRRLLRLYVGGRSKKQKDRDGKRQGHKPQRRPRPVFDASCRREPDTTPRIVIMFGHVHRMPNETKLRGAPAHTLA